jgi:hypothetical protein
MDANRTTEPDKKVRVVSQKEKNKTFTWEMRSERLIVPSTFLLLRGWHRMIRRNHMQQCKADIRMMKKTLAGIHALDVTPLYWSLNKANMMIGTSPRNWRLTSQQRNEQTRQCGNRVDLQVQVRVLNQRAKEEGGLQMLQRQRKGRRS